MRRHHPTLILLTAAMALTLSAPSLAAEPTARSAAKAAKATPAKPKPRKKPRPKKKKPTRAEVIAHNDDTIAHLMRVPITGVTWRRIVIHHTATGAGSVANISAYHKKRFNDPDGIQYHFLIGNGRGHPNGWIALGRWPLQKRAIHLFRPERAPDAIAVSLVGNFETRKLGDAQYQATVRLVTALCRAYGIDPAMITTHRRVDGRLTQCPGKHFPYERLVRDVRARLAAPAHQEITPAP